jgi:hypothetical protein
MRQELLAHLTAVYDEERGRLGDDHLAVYQALRRFGDPAELTRELQAAVPRLEWMICTPIPGLGWMNPISLDQVLLVPPGRSPLRSDARLAGIFTAVFVCLLLAPVLLQGDPLAGGSGTWGGVGCLGLIAAHTFVSTLLCLGFCRAAAGSLRPKSMFRPACYGAGVLLSGLALVAGLSVLQSENPLWQFLLDSPAKLFGAAVTGSVFLLIAAVVVRVAAKEWNAAPVG